MNEVAFVEKREPDWIRLTHLCDRADASPALLKPNEFHEFVKLYRRVSSDLALARTKSSNLELIDFLNNLVGRAYGVLYRSPRRSFFASVRDALRLSAQTVRKCQWFILSSALLFVGSILFAFFILKPYPSASEHLVPPGWEETVEHWKSGKAEARGTSESVGMTGFYLSNNPRAAIMGGSIAASTFGVGTAYVLFTNGALMGALMHEVQPVGRLGHLLTWISPHGVPELTGLVFSGAAGFVMAWALINPGRRKRGEALREAGKDAIILLTTSVVLMFIAAPIEGFFSFNPRVPDVVKIAVAGVSAIAWGFFWVGFGRTEEEKANSVRVAQDLQAEQPA